MSSFLKYIRKHKVATIIIATCVAAPVVGYGLMNKETLTLNVFDNTLVWNYNKSLNNNKFVLYRNGEAILSSTQTKLKDINSDAIAPEPIRSVDVQYLNGKIILKWVAPIDKGNVNEYYVNVESNIGGILATSEKVTMESSSGISKYLVYFNNKEYTVEDPSFAIESEDIIDGIYDVKIVAVDKSNNESDPFIKTLQIYKPYISNNMICINNKKSYIFKAYIDGNPILLNGRKIDSSSLKDITAPGDISDISIWKHGNSASLAWSNVKDVGTEYSVSIIGTAGDGEQVIGEGKAMSNASGVSGYYYRVNALAEYSVSSSDNFSSNSIVANVELPYDTTYIHVAAVDSAGNIGKTYTKSIVKDKSDYKYTSTPDKENQNGDTNVNEKDNFEDSSENMITNENSNSIGNKIFDITGKINGLIGDVIKR